VTSVSASGLDTDPVQIAKDFYEQVRFFANIIVNVDETREI
jgi:hypothetical protein